MQSGKPLFDVNTFLETQHTGGMDTTFVLVPDGWEGPATTTDKIAIRAGVVSDGDYAGNIWGSLDLQWEINDDDLKKKMNMDKVLVRQSFMLDYDQVAWRERQQAILDFGVNKNMRVKRILDALGLNKAKNWNFNMLKFQPAIVQVKHRMIEDFDDPIAEVVRVSSIKSQRAAA